MKKDQEMGLGFEEHLAGFQDYYKKENLHHYLRFPPVSRRRN
jgi:hypothetical protein